MDPGELQQGHLSLHALTKTSTRMADTGEPAEHGTESETQSPILTSHSPSARVRRGSTAAWSVRSSRSESGPGLQLGHYRHQQDNTDHIFPIRSVVSMNPAGRTAGEGDSLFRTRSLGSQPEPPGNTSESLDTTTLRASSLDGGAPSSGSTPGPVASPVKRPERRPQVKRSRTEADADRRHVAKPLQIYAGDASDASDDEKTDITGPSESSHVCGSHGENKSTGSAGKAPESLTTVRFQHVMTDEGHAVITGREGRLQRCEDEPIHMPGAVQSFGVLLAFREESDGRYQVRYVSENSARIIGYSPQELFTLENFIDIFNKEQTQKLLDHMDYVQMGVLDPPTNDPEVFSISIRPPKRKSVKLWCAIHISLAHPELYICEFEFENDRLFPLRPPTEQAPEVPEDTLHASPTQEELAESTEVASKPLKVFRSARRQRGETDAMHMFDIMSQVQEQVASAPTLEMLLKIVVGIIKQVTGFHRVMIYEFDSSFNGKVVAENVDLAQTRDLYNGLQFPASDIPPQARDLYKINKVRLLYDREAETARIVCRTMEDLETPLDMTHAYLRAMSPIHLKYLGNMAVRSSMSISMDAFNELWGLIACHSYGPRGMRVSFVVRKMCRHIGDTVSRSIERLSLASRLQSRKLINTVPTHKNPSGYIVASSDDLLKLFDADFGMLSIHDETKVLGKLEQSQEALAMLEYLRMRRFTAVVATRDTAEDFLDLRYPPGFSVIAGLLYVPLSLGGNDFIVFFRKGQVKDVKWAGNPYEKIIREGTAGYLEPRTSFKTWHETVAGKCRAWSEEQIETAAVLCLVYGKFIEVWRQKEAALRTSKLTKLLLANSAHEVRTPLNAIINYLEVALEGSLDQETRDNLARSHSASKSLICVINDLLDLTKTEEGQGLVKDDVFDLAACIREATEPFKSDARRKGISYEMVEHPGLPQHVVGDERKVRQAVANITANAVQHTTTGSVRIDLYLADVQESRVRIGIVVEDTGSGMDNAQLDGLFRELEQVTTDAHESEPEPGDDKGKEREPESRTLGLGLAVVARIVRNMDGQLRLKSEEGKGSRFMIQFPFELPPGQAANALQGRGTPSPKTEGAPFLSTAETPTLTLPPCETEVVFASRGRSASLPNAVAPEKRKSFDDGASVHSQRSNVSKSSSRRLESDADRLIHAIQTPLALGEPESGAPSIARRSSDDAPYKTASPWASRDGVRSVSPSRDGRRSVGARPSASGPAKGISKPAGLELVTDSRTPIRPVKMRDECGDETAESSSRPGAGLGISHDRGSPETAGKQRAIPAPAPSPKAKPGHLRVLVAEDDPINFKILAKRLLKAGHQVGHAANGEDCAQMYAETPDDFDVVLMDMQMPIVDGLGSTKMIRARETARSGGKERVPIFAVSASLVEHDKDAYVEAGFDGWILKPIDFKRLETLLAGIEGDAVRNQCLYQPGDWEHGGWFTKRTGSD